ncbi:MAG: hypothetical protein O3C40_13425 [Planctomycetota bacterium]|nr:hypothetical protein [Planctomycetota bacterium]
MDRQQVWPELVPLELPVRVSQAQELVPVPAQLVLLRQVVLVQVLVPELVLLRQVLVAVELRWQHRPKAMFQFPCRPLHHFLHHCLPYHPASEPDLARHSSELHRPSEPVRPFELGLPIFGRRPTTRQLAVPDNAGREPDGKPN